TPIPLETLAANDLSIKLNIGELRYLQDSITNLRLDLEQRDGSLNISDVFYEAPQGTLGATLSINPTNGNKADVKLDLNTRNFVFNVSGLPDEKLAQVPAFDIDFRASGQGGNLREVAGSLNGSLYIGSKGGNAENVDLGILETFIFDEIFSVLTPKTRDDLNTQFSCIATIMTIDDGLVTTNPAFAFSTPKIAVITKGTLDLKTERMNFNFNSTPTKALKINAGEMFYPYILISGTLAAPKVGVDPGKAAMHGGAAIATLGLSVLAKGVLDRAGNAIPVCEEMLNNPPK
ncbi:MAG: AsmA-like C-terminal region-containing protein, partial [Lysobacterales bacterium]